MPHCTQHSWAFSLRSEPVLLVLPMQCSLCDVLPVESTQSHTLAQFKISATDCESSLLESKWSLNQHGQTVLKPTLYMFAYIITFRARPTKTHDRRRYLCIPSNELNGFLPDQFGHLHLLWKRFINPTRIFPPEAGKKRWGRFPYRDMPLTVRRPPWSGHCREFMHISALIYGPAIRPCLPVSSKSVLSLRQVRQDRREALWQHLKICTDDANNQRETLQSKKQLRGVDKHFDMMRMMTMVRKDDEDC